MAIQFHCPGCSQPIEVDDVYAGQTAACPYCRRVVTVPEQSSLEHTPRIPARPAEHIEDDRPEGADIYDGCSFPTPPPPVLGGLHIGATLTPREQSARQLSIYALICTALAVLLIGTVVVGTLSVVGSQLLQAQSQPTPAEVTAATEKLAQMPWLTAVQFGSLFFALVGLVLGVTSLLQSRQKNWRAVVSVIINGLLLLCVCGGTVLAAANGMGGIA